MLMCCNYEGARGRSRRGRCRMKRHIEEKLELWIVEMELRWLIALALGI